MERATRRHSRFGKQRSRHQRRLRLEPLEDRRLLTADTVAALLTTYDLTGAPITSITEGEQFLLEVFVQDISDNPQGVYSAYMDITYDSTLATPDVSEVQSVELPLDTYGGTFTLSLDGQTTAALAFNATVNDLQIALEALSNIGPGEVVVIKSFSSRSTSWDVTFFGSLANQDMPELIGDGSNLTGFGWQLGDDQIVVTEVTTDRAIHYGPDFRNVQSGDVGTDGLLDEVGATSSRMAGLGDVPVELFRMQFTASSAGSLAFVADLPDELPNHEWLRFGVNDVVPPAEIALSQVTITVNPLNDPPRVASFRFEVLADHGATWDATLVVEFTEDVFVSRSDVLARDPQGANAFIDLFSYRVSTYRLELEVLDLAKNTLYTVHLLDSIVGVSLRALDGEFDGTTFPSGDGLPGGAFLAEFGRDMPEVVGRYAFYNNSAFDGNDPWLGGRDDDAIAVDKVALLPGETATAANVTSFERGINGVMIDVYEFAQPTNMTLGDFAFRVGNVDEPETWNVGPAPVYGTVRPGAGIDGSDRVTLLWADGAVRNTWLEVTIKANAVTGLVENDVFYFGNAVGEMGNDPTNALVNAADVIAIRDNPRGTANPAGIDNPCDINRDMRADAVDLILARNNAMGPLAALRLITPAVGIGVAPALLPEGGGESGEREAESGEREAESGEREAESGEREAEIGERKAESGGEIAIAAAGWVAGVEPRGTSGEPPVIRAWGFDARSSHLNPSHPADLHWWDEL